VLDHLRSSARIVCSRLMLNGDLEGGHHAHAASTPGDRPHVHRERCGVTGPATTRPAAREAAGSDIEEDIDKEQGFRKSRTWDHDLQDYVDEDDYE
jgi:hypothetical protein